MCTECFTYAPRAHSRTAYGACSMTFPHGCGDHHFLYLKKLFRGEAAGTLFHEDETRLTRARWLRRNARSEEHTSALQSLMRSSSAVFCLKNKQQARNRS